MSPLRTFLREGIVLPCLCLTFFCARAQTLVLDPAFDPGSGADAQVTRMLPRTDGKVMVLGHLLDYGGTPVGRIALLNADGTLDPTFAAGTGFNGPVQDAVMQPDSKVVVCGAFTTYNGLSLPGRLIRLMPDGTVDATFQQLPFGLTSINSLSLMADGRIVVGGNMGTSNQTRVCRLMPNGTADPTFNTALAFNDFVQDVYAMPDGRILAVGGFTLVHGSPRNRVCVLNMDGSLYNGFDPGTGPDAIPSEALVTTTGRIVLAGSFQNFNGASARRIVTLQADGTIDPLFASGTAYNASVTHLSEADDGNLWVAGNMATYNGAAVAALHKLRPDGSVLPVFATTSALNGPPLALTPADGSIYIGGFFTTVSGVSRVRVARLFPCTSSTWYADADEDGFGDPGVINEACDQPTGYVNNDDDCDDGDELVTTGTLWYMDQDGDGFGNVMAPTVTACIAPNGHVADNTDCNDFDPTAHLLQFWYADADGDGVGDAGDALEACSKPTGYVANDTDCDDNDPLATIARTWYADSDSDGFGNLAAPQFSCSQPPAHVLDNTDCDDSAWWITGQVTWYVDSDGDGSGSPGDSIVSCTEPEGYAPSSDDCDDTDPDIYLYAPCNDNDALTHYDEIGADCTCRGRGVRVTPIIYLDVLRDTEFGMSATLFDLGLIPLNEPYTELGYALVNDVGNRYTTAEMLDPVPSQPELQAVDWVVVELRSAVDPGDVVASQACLLRRNGTIHRPDMLDAPEFRMPEGAYFIAVRHRTHLGVMTQNAVGLDQPSPAYLDFASGVQPPNGGVAAMRPSGDAWVLWQGDVRFNGNVQYTGSNNDRDRILTRIGGSVATATVAGYHSEDVNMDGVVKYTGANNDRDVILQTIGGVIPTSVRVDNLPD